MHLVLTLPGLLAPDAKRDGAAPHLARLLALCRVRKREREPDGQDAALAAAYGIERGNDWPLAPIRAAALGIDTGTSYWLAADPVTLEAGRDDVRLAGAVRDLDASDAAAIVAALNTHFAGDGIAFVAARPDAWFVRTEARVALFTRPLAIVAGRMLRDFLPTGADAGTWRRWQNEIEMLLHAHPVNAARERTGKAPANGLWFSEGGALPRRTTHEDGIRTFADGGVAVALAAHAGQPVLAVPTALEPALAQSSNAHTIVVALEGPLGVRAIERAWAAPAWSALASGRLETVTVIADGDGGAVTWFARRPGIMRRIALAFTRHDLARELDSARGRA